MRERCQDPGSKLTPEVLQLLAGTAGIIVLTADYTAFTNPSSSNLTIGVILSAAFLVGLVILATYFFRATTLAPGNSKQRSARFGAHSRIAAIIAVLVVAAVTAGLFRQSTALVVPDTPVYLFNASSRTLIVSGAGEFTVDPASVSTNQAEPVSGQMLLRTNPRGGDEGADIVVGPATSMTVFARVVDADHYRQTIQSGTARITIYVELKSPAKLKLPSAKCGLGDHPDPQTACTVHLV